MTDFDLQQQLAAQRRQQYAQQSQFNAPQGQMIGRHYVAPNALQYLASGLRSLGGMRGQQLAEEELGQIQQGKNQAIASALRGFSDMAQGRPADVLPPDQAGPVRPAQAPDMAGAYQSLLSAPTTELRQMGMQGLTQQAQANAKSAQEAQWRQILASAPDAQAAQRAGVPADYVKSYYELRNAGRDKVKFTDVGGKLVPVNEYGEVPSGVVSLDKTGNPFSDLLVRDPTTGSLVPNAPLVTAKERIAKARASKTNVSVNMPDKKFYEGLGTAVSGQIEKGFEQAQSAVQTLNNANQIASGLEKAFVGPLANQRVTLAQIGQVLGVSGKDATEALVNTRNVIQGLARQELAAAGQMKGQGQITENERAILKKAEAGEISTMTKPELQTFIGAIRKTARSRIAAHQRNIQQLGSDPQAATILPYLQVEVPQDFGGQPMQPSGMPQGFQVIR